MKTQDIHLADWQRILVGEVPASFYIELIIRGIAIYILLLVAMRLMGKRMSSQLSRNELAALVSLAAAIGIPLQAADRGILPAIIIAAIVVYIERWISSKAFKNQKFERYSQGNISMLIKDSVIDMKTMLQVRLTPERLHSQLRSQGIKHLGEVKRFYMEANGSFTLIQNEKPGPGLSVIPKWDKDYYARQQKTDDTYTCDNCGNLHPRANNLNTLICSNCKAQMWIPAAVS